MLMNKNYIIILFLSIFFISCEDSVDKTSEVISFKKSYGGIHEEYAYGSTISFDGGVVIAGFSTTFSQNSNWDAWVVKTDSDGNGQWSQNYGKAGREVFYSASQASAEEYIFAGYSTSFGRKEDFYIVKTNRNGKVIWEKAFGGPDNDAAFDIITTSDGNFAVTGYTYSYGLGGRDLWVIKLSQEGEVLWETNFGKYYNDMGYAIKETNDGGLVVVGYTDVYSKEFRYMWIIQLDSNGNELWNKVIDYNGYSLATDVITNKDGSIIIGGQTDSLKNGWLDFWAIKMDFIGNIIWSNIYNTSSTNTWKMVSNYSGGFTALGTTTMMNQEREDFLLINFNDSGEIQWSQNYGGRKFEIGGKLVQFGFGAGFGLTGTTKSFGNGVTDYYFIKTDELGNW